jgi:hypothetical protein
MPLAQLLTMMSFEYIFIIIFLSVTSCSIGRLCMRRRWTHPLKKIIL